MTLTSLVAVQSNIHPGPNLPGQVTAMFTIISAIAELERNIIVERIKGGLRRAKAMGKKIGRPGLQMNTEQIMSLKTQGLSIRAIAKQVGASPSYIHKVLQASHAGVTSV